jgi:hypothetical protein
LCVRNDTASKRNNTREQKTNPRTALFKENWHGKGGEKKRGRGEKYRLSLSLKGKHTQRVETKEKEKEELNETKSTHPVRWDCIKTRTNKIRGKGKLKETILLDVWKRVDIASCTDFFCLILMFCTISYDSIIPRPREVSYLIDTFFFRTWGSSLLRQACSHCEKKIASNLRSDFFFFLSDSTHAICISDTQVLRFFVICFPPPLLECVYVVGRV